MTANQISHAQQIAEKEHMERSDAENARHNRSEESISTTYNNELQRHNAAMENIQNRQQEIDQERNRINAALQFADTLAKVALQDKANKLKQEELSLQKVKYSYDYDLEKARQQLLSDQNKETERHNKAVEQLNLFTTRRELSLKARQIEYQHTYWRDSISNQLIDINSRAMQNVRLFSLEQQKLQLQQQEFQFNSEFTAARTKKTLTETNFIPWNSFYGAIGQASNLFRIGGF